MEGGVIQSLDGLLTKYSKEPIFRRPSDKNNIMLNVIELRCSIEREFQEKLRVGIKDDTNDWIVTNEFGWKLRFIRGLLMGVFIGLVLVWILK